MQYDVLSQMDFKAQACFCQGTQKREVPLLFFSLMSLPLADISHKVSLFSVPASIRLQLNHLGIIHLNPILPQGISGNSQPGQIS